MCGPSRRPLTSTSSPRSLLDSGAFGDQAKFLNTRESPTHPSEGGTNPSRTGTMRFSPGDGADGGWPTGSTVDMPVPLAGRRMESHPGMSYRTRAVGTAFGSDLRVVP